MRQQATIFLLIVGLLALTVSAGAPALTPSQFLAYANYAIANAPAQSTLVTRLAQSNALAYLKGLVAA